MQRSVIATAVRTGPLRTNALVLAVSALVTTVPATAAAAQPPADSGPPAVTPADIQCRNDTLRRGSAREVGLLPEHVDRMPADLAAYLQPTPDHPGYLTYAGAVVLAAKDGVIVQHAAVGAAVRYAAAGPPPGLVGVELPADQQLPMRPDTIFDLASVSKLFTTIVTMQQVERGRVDLDAPVARYLPEFAAGGKAAVTVRMLLTHTSGLPAFTPLWSRYPTQAERFAAALATPLSPGATPGARYVYSDLGLIALGVAFGHTGFTGTWIVLDPLSHSFVILLSNRVHPDLGWGSNNVARRAVARDLAEAMPVRPRSRDAWRADPRDLAAGTLTAPLRRAAPGGSASFLLWYDTEPRYDSARFEVSTDGGRTWAPGRMLLRYGDRRWISDVTVTGYGGRVWWQVSVELPEQATHVRWSSSTDGSGQGRGVYVDRIVATDRDGLLFHGEGGDAPRLVADGWSPARA